MNFKNICLIRLIILIPLLASCDSIRDEDRMCQVEQQSDRNEASLEYASGFYSKEFAERIEPDHCGRKFEFLSEIETEWYSGQWNATCEPSLYKFSKKAPKAAFSLRLSYLPSFDPSRFLRIESDGKEHKLIIKEINEEGGFDSEGIVRSKEVLLSDNEMADVEKLLEELESDRVEEKIENQRLAEQRIKYPDFSCGASFDGIQWIFETARTDQYDMYKYNNLYQGPGYRLGRMLFEKAGWWSEESN